MEKERRSKLQKCKQPVVIADHFEDGEEKKERGRRALSSYIYANGI